MSTLIRYSIAFVIAVTTLFSLQSCDNEPSLQKYMVEKQDDDKFLKVDLASSLLLAEDNKLSVEDREILNTVKKVNIVAFQLKDENMTEYEVEKRKVKEILDNEKYQTLMKYGSSQNGATLKFVGNEDAIDEFVAFGSDESKGFAVVRITGKNMKPADIMGLIGNIGSGDLNMSALSGLGSMFDMPNAKQFDDNDTDEIALDLEKTDSLDN